MFLFFFSFYLGLSPVDVAIGRKVQTVLRGVLIYFDTVCDKNLPYKTTCNFFLYGLLFERALTFVKFFLFLFFWAFSVCSFNGVLFICVQVCSLVKVCFFTCRCLGRTNQVF